jgi:porphobilinogen deaminase
MGVKVGPMMISVTRVDVAVGGEVVAGATVALGTVEGVAVGRRVAVAVGGGCGVAVGAAAQATDETRSTNTSMRIAVLIRTASSPR